MYKLACFDQKTGLWSQLSEMISAVYSLGEGDLSTQSVFLSHY